MELAGVEDVVVGTGVEVGLELLFRRSDEHIMHEQCVVCAGTHHSDFDAEVLLPAGVTIQYVELR